VIVILKRYDLPEEHRNRPAEELELQHFELSPEVIEKAELIVLVEGSYTRYFKHTPEIQFTNKFDVLAQYITSVSFKERPRWSVPRLGRRGKRK
jgi:hypothetical protein